MYSQPTLAVHSFSVRRGEHHRFDRVTDSVWKYENLTNHGSYIQDDKEETEQLQFRAPPTLQPQKEPYQKLCSLML